MRTYRGRMNQVIVQIDGEVGAIAADTLAIFLQRSLGMLRELDKISRPNEGGRSRWRIRNVSNESISVTLEPEADIATEVPLRLVEGLTVLAERPELPPWFSVIAIGEVQKLRKVFRDPGVAGLGITAVIPQGKETEARVTPRLVEHAAEAFRAKDEAAGSVVGILDVVNLRGGHRVSLYDANERHAVRCSFPEALLENVRSYLGIKVRAIGTVVRNKVGQIALVRAESLERLDEQIAPPSVAELTGIAPWYTGERTAEEHQRWTRGA